MCNKVTAEQKYQNIMMQDLTAAKELAATEGFWPAADFKQILKDVETNRLSPEEFKQSCAYSYVTKYYSELHAKQSEQLYLQGLSPFNGLKVAIKDEVELTELIRQICPELSSEDILNLIQTYQVKIQQVVAYNPKSIFQLGGQDFHIEINNLISTNIRLVKAK